MLRKQVGVIDTEVGYAGGTNDNPTYEYHPGHAEVVRVTYDTTQTSMQALIRYFFKIHDPTTVNRQGNDIGTSYRSVIFYNTEEEKAEIENIIAQVSASRVYPGPVVTQVMPTTAFYIAEEYHQEYLRKNPGGYTCHFERITDAF